MSCYNNNNNKLCLIISLSTDQIPSDSKRG